MMKKLTVVIVNYNVKDYAGQCLCSLRRALAGIDAQVVVVDNHSRDGSVEYLSREFPEVTVIAGRHNLGFARANNLAIADTASEYVLLLNPDTIVGETTLHEALGFMDAHADAGSLGVRMLQADGSDARESRRGLPRPVVAFYKMVGLCSRFPHSRRFARYYMGHLPWDAPACIEVVSGAFCLLRREAIDRVGLLDEDFFMYGEDIDLSYRLLKGGYHNYYLPAKILHYKGESTQHSSFRYVHVFYGAMLIFFRKHYGGMSRLLALPIKTAIYLKASLAHGGMAHPAHVGLHGCRLIRRQLLSFHRFGSDDGALPETCCAPWFARFLHRRRPAVAARGPSCPVVVRRPGSRQGGAGLRGL